MVWLSLYLMVVVCGVNAAGVDKLRHPDPGGEYETLLPIHAQEVPKPNDPINEQIALARQKERPFFIRQFPPHNHYWVCMGVISASWDDKPPGERCVFYVFGHLRRHPNGDFVVGDDTSYKCWRAAIIFDENLRHEVGNPFVWIVHPTHGGDTHNVKISQFNANQRLGAKVGRIGRLLGDGERQKHSGRLSLVNFSHHLNRGLSSISGPDSRACGEYIGNECCYNRSKPPCTEQSLRFRFIGGSDSGICRPPLLAKISFFLVTGVLAIWSIIAGLLLLLFDRNSQAPHREQERRSWRYGGASVIRIKRG